jgi:hypothetical protein
MEISMAKAIRKTSKSSTNVPQGAPPASPEIVNKSEVTPSRNVTTPKKQTSQQSKLFRMKAAGRFSSADEKLLAADRANRLSGSSDAPSAELLSAARKRRTQDRATKAAEQAARIRHVEGLRAQMQKAGVDMSKPAPGISRLNPDTQMAIDLSGKPFMSSAAAKEKAKNNRGFKGIVKRILRSAGNILSGSHQNVASRQPIEGRGIKLNPPMKLQKKS